MWLAVYILISAAAVLGGLLLAIGARHCDSPIEKEFETKWRIGGITAAIIVRLTSRFRSEISLSDGEDTVNTKSIMGVMMLQSEADSETLRDAGLKAGSRIRVTARGPDAAAAMDALSEFFSCGARITVHSQLTPLTSTQCGQHLPRLFKWPRLDMRRSDERRSFLRDQTRHDNSAHNLSCEEIVIGRKNSAEIASAVTPLWSHDGTL